MTPTVEARIAQQWMAGRLVRPGEMGSVIARAGAHRGARALARLLEGAIEEADSVPEARLGQLLIADGIPPVLHLLVTTPLGATYELDWAYPDAHVALELDGYGVHLRSEATFESDRFHPASSSSQGGWSSTSRAGSAGGGPTS